LTANDEKTGKPGSVTDKEAAERAAKKVGDADI